MSSFSNSRALTDVSKIYEDVIRRAKIDGSSTIYFTLSGKPSVEGPVETKQSLFCFNAVYDKEADTFRSDVIDYDAKTRSQMRSGRYDNLAVGEFANKLSSSFSQIDSADRFDNIACVCSLDSQKRISYYAANSKGRMSYYAVNSKGSPVFRKYYDESYKILSYDEYGHISKTIDSDGVQTDYICDKDTGVCTSYRDTRGHWLEARYDDEGNYTYKETDKGVEIDRLGVSSPVVKPMPRKTVPSKYQDMADSIKQYADEVNNSFEF